MGKKYYGEYTPVTRNEWLQHALSREFQREWFPFCRNTMRQACNVRFHAQRFDRIYHWGRYPYRLDARNWKHYRRTQYKVVNDVRIL